MKIEIVVLSVLFTVLITFSFNKHKFEELGLAAVLTVIKHPGKHSS